MTQPPTFSRGLSEIVLIVSDVPRAAQFYREVVGLVPAREANDEWAWFWAGPPANRQRVALHKGTLLFEEHSPHPAGQRWGQVHYAFEVSRADLEAAAAHVRAAGVAVYGPTRFEWMGAVSYYFYDPDGNLLEWWSPDPEGLA
jgi:catechol 2,3-dioxygenase-like lactoylglutathione lyase family enzyme